MAKGLKKRFVAYLSDEAWDVVNTYRIQRASKLGEMPAYTEIGEMLVMKNLAKLIK